MRLHAGHARQRFPIPAIHDAAYAAHAAKSSFVRRLSFQFVDLGFDVKELYALQAAVDQSGNAIQKT